MIHQSHTFEIEELGPGVTIRTKFWRMVANMGFETGATIPSEVMDKFFDALPKGLRKTYNTAMLRLNNEGYVKSIDGGDIVLKEIP